MNFKLFPINFFIFSLFLHIIIFASFIFVLPIDEIPFKPKLVFLGSILEQQDIRNYNSTKKNISSQITSEEWRYKKHSVSNNPFFTPFIKKPLSQKKSLELKEKITLKSTFVIKKQESKKEVKKEEINIKGLENGLEVIPYQPLRFHTR